MELLLKDLDPHPAPFDSLFAPPGSSVPQQLLASPAVSRSFFQSLYPPIEPHPLHVTAEDDAASANGKRSWHQLEASDEVGVRAP
jgi:hypothetical protein